MEGPRSTDAHVPDPVSARGRFVRWRPLSDGPAQHAAVARAVSRAKAGDRDALGDLYSRYADNVYGFVLSILRDEHEAEDVTQHVFAKLMTVLPAYEERGVPFHAWVLRVARNAALDHLRRRRPIPYEDVDAGAASPSEVGAERWECLRDALGSLSEDQREVVVLRHVLGLSPREIASRLGKSEGSIHGLHHRGRGALQQALRDLDSAPMTRAA
jgi:RNA polymerase sigma-70 factor (ECF subfamily)